MSNDLSSFISNYQLENPSLFDFVHRTIHQLEQTCTQENSKFQRNNSMAQSTNRESLLGTHDSAKRLSKSRNHNQLDSTETSTDLYVPFAENLVVSETSSCNTNSFMEAEKKNTVAALKELLLSRETSAVKDSQLETQKSNSKKDLVPFFALNIKPVKITQSSIIFKEGESTKHSPIFKLASQRSLDLSSDKIDHSSRELAHSIMQLTYNKSPDLFLENNKTLLELDLDEHILVQNFLQGIRNIEKRCSSRKETFTEIIEYIFSNKNLREDAHNNHPRIEVIYSTEIFARDLLKNLSSLIENLNKEDVSAQMKIVNEKKFLETHFQRFMRTSGATLENIKGLRVKISIDETEIRAIYERMLKISNNLSSKSKSKEMMRKNIHYLQKLLEKFPCFHTNSSDRVCVDTEIEIKYITVRKLIEKATEAVDTLIAEKLKRITILTYDHFIKPLSLLLLLTEKYYTPQPFMLTHEEYLRFKEHHSNTRRKRIIEILDFWIDCRPIDFVTNSDLLGLLVIFLESIYKFEKEHAKEKDFLAVHEKVENLIEKSNSIGKKALVKPNRRKIERVKTLSANRSRFFFVARKQLNTDENQRLSKQDSEEVLSFKDDLRSDENLSDVRIKRVMSASIGRRLAFSNKARDSDEIYHFLSWETDEIVEQMALIESKMFRKVQISHMMLLRWSKPAFVEECTEVYNIVNRFNSFSFWVQYMVINGSDLRTHLLDKFISIAFKNYQIQNYASAHSIFTALLRIQKTKLWNISKDKEETWEALQKIFTSATFFQDMEKNLRAANPPAVPSIPFFTNRFFRLQDNVAFLIKLDNPRRYLKSIQLAQLSDYCLLMRKFQTEIYEFCKNPMIYRFLKRDYKSKEDIDFNHQDTEVILRTRILDEELKS